MNTIINRYNNAKTEDRPAIIAELEEAIKAENRRRKTATINALMSTANTEGKGAFWSQFMTMTADVVAYKRAKKDDKPAILQAIKSKSVSHYFALSTSEDEDTGDISLIELPQGITFQTVEKAWAALHDGESLIRDKGVARMVSRVNYAQTKVTASELAINGKMSYTAKKGDTTAMSIDGVDFSKTSVGGMRDALEKIVAAILPDSMTLNMVKADARYVIEGIKNAKYASVNFKNEKATLEVIVEAMSVNYAGIGYTVKTGASWAKEPKPKMANEKQSAKTEEKMSKVPERPEAKSTLSKKNKAEADAVKEVA